MANYKTKVKVTENTVKPISYTTNKDNASQRNGYTTSTNTVKPISYTTNVQPTSPAQQINKTALATAEQKAASSKKNSGGSSSPTATYTPTPVVAPVAPVAEDYMDEDMYLRDMVDYGSYDSKYEGQIQSLLDQILNKKPFDISSDANYQNLYDTYKESYMNQGRIASQNAMAEAAGLTGGYGSSVASIAGQQAYDNYLSQLNDRNIDLTNLAYGMYQDANNDKYNQLEAVLGLDSADYGRWADQRNFDVSERETAYERYGDALQKAQAMAKQGYQVPSIYASVIGGSLTNQLNQLAAQMVAQKGSGSRTSGNNENESNAVEREVAMQMKANNDDSYNNYMAASILADSGLSDKEIEKLAKKYGVDFDSATSVASMSSRYTNRGYK